MTRTYKDYPKRFVQIWEEFMKGDFVLDFPSKGAAISMRQQLNRFRYAWRAAHDKTPMENVFDDWELRIKVLPDGTARIHSVKSDWRRQIEERLKANGTITPSNDGTIQPTKELRHDPFEAIKSSVQAGPSSPRGNPGGASEVPAGKQEDAEPKGEEQSSIERYFARTSKLDS